MLSKEQAGDALFQLALNEVARSNFIFAQSVGMLPLPPDLERASAIANGWAYFCALATVSGYKTSLSVFGPDEAREWLSMMSQYLSQFAQNEGHRIKVNLTVAE
jgi:hypothetical protein